MKNFKPSTYFACVCVLLLLVGSILLSACGGETTTTVTATSVSTKTATATATTTATATATQTVEPPPAEIPTTVLIGPQSDLYPEAGMTPQYGGIVTMIMDNTVSNLGAPWKKMGGHERGWNRFTTENLIGLDHTGTPVPQLATSWDLDTSAKTITFHLREGVKFSDGTDFNAEAAKWCMDMNIDSGMPYLAAVTSIEAVDTYTLKLTMDPWDPALLKNLSGSQAGDMVSPTAAIAAGDDDVRTPVGTGPFILDSYVPQVSFTFVANPNYWQEGLPYLDGVTVLQGVDRQVMVTSFKKGEAEFIVGFDIQDALELQEMGYKLNAATSTVSGWGPDSENADSPLSDVRVRQALAYGMNNAVNCDAVHLGLRPAINQIAIAGQAGYDETIKGYPYDPDKAEELLTAAGYGPSNPLNLTYYYNGDPTMADYVLLCAGDLAPLGVNIELEANDNATDHALMANGWTNGFVSFRMDYNTIEVEYSAGLQNKLSPDAMDYASIYYPPEYVEMYEEIQATENLADRVPLYKAINKYATDELCIILPSWANWNYPALDQSKLHWFGMRERAVWETLPEIIWLSQ